MEILIPTLLLIGRMTNTRGKEGGSVPTPTWRSVDGRCLLLWVLCLCAHSRKRGSILKQCWVCPVPHRSLFEKIFSFCLQLLLLWVTDTSQVQEGRKEDTSIMFLGPPLYLLTSSPVSSYQCLLFYIQSKRTSF